MKVWDADAVMRAIKLSAHEAASNGDHAKAVFARGCLTILEKMPQIDVTDGIECRRCFFYDNKSKRCIHRNGLNGRVLPEMYCSYGSYHHDGHEIDEDDEDSFEEFEEGEDES